jgi:hypothetical protein
LTTSTDSRESSLENRGGGELDFGEYALYVGSKKGELDLFVVVACGGDEGGTASLSIIS